MTWKQINTSREIRMWIGTIAAATFTVASIPSLRDKVETTYNRAKLKVQELIQKRKGES